MKSNQRVGPGGWPLPPPFAQAWMTRRAVWWLRLIRAGGVHRFHSDMTGLARRRTGPGQGHGTLFAYGDALRQEWRARIEAGPAGPALARADHPNYLGSREVVRGLVDGYIALLIARAGGTAPHTACADEMHRLARIFSGSEPGFATIGGWNTLGQLGDAAIRHMPLNLRLCDAVLLDDVLQETFAAVGLTALQILRAAERSQLSADAALSRLSDLAERTTALLLGTLDRDPAEAKVLSVASDLRDLPEPGTVANDRAG